MKEGKAEIVAILDMSGSMRGQESDVIGGFNNFLEDQKNEEGEAYLTLVTFSSTYNIVHDAVDIQEVDEIDDSVYRPIGSTALLDTLGTMIDKVGNRLYETDPSERPEHVIFFVFTDGYENASKEYNATRIKQMIEHQQEKYSWEFLYAGANQDAFTVAGSMGIKGANTMNFADNSEGYTKMYTANSMAVSNIRNGSGNSDVTQDEDTLESETN